LDTRTKIVSRAEIEGHLKGGRAAWVAGHFDPLLAEHVRRLAQARQPGRPLVVEVTNLAQPLLGQRARAELVAALSMVDFVVIGDGSAGMDADVTERFVEHVLCRHRQESAR
jgi:bifunctional ADP-heptose synthase (sugar kinase/adenylyltransferase)